MVLKPAILERVIDPGRGDFSVELAKQILTFDFPPADHERYGQLAARAQAGTLSEAEREELDEYLNVNDFLILLKAKARASLKRHSSAA